MFKILAGTLFLAIGMVTSASAQILCPNYKAGPQLTLLLNQVQTEKQFKVYIKEREAVALYSRQISVCVARGRGMDPAQVLAVRKDLDTEEQAQLDGIADAHKWHRHAIDFAGISAKALTSAPAPIVRGPSMADFDAGNCKIKAPSGGWLLNYLANRAAMTAFSWRPSWIGACNDGIAVAPGILLERYTDSIGGVRTEGTELTRIDSFTTQAEDAPGTFAKVLEFVWNDGRDFYNIYLDRRKLDPDYKQVSDLSGLPDWAQGAMRGQGFGAVAGNQVAQPRTSAADAFMQGFTNGLARNQITQQQPRTTQQQTASQQTRTNPAYAMPRSSSQSQMGTPNRVSAGTASTRPPPRNGAACISAQSTSGVEKAVTNYAKLTNNCGYTVFVEYCFIGLSNTFGCPHTGQGMRLTPGHSDFASAGAFDLKGTQQIRWLACEEAASIKNPVFNGNSFTYECAWP